MSEQEERQAYNDGYAYGKRGGEDSDNPYSINTQHNEHMLWERGRAQGWEETENEERDFHNGD